MASFQDILTGGNPKQIDITVNDLTITGDVDLGLNLTEGLIYKDSNDDLTSIPNGVLNQALIIGGSGVPVWTNIAFPPANPQGLQYSDGSSVNSIPNGTANQMLVMDGTGTNLLWTNQSVNPVVPSEGVQYSDGVSLSSITNGAQNSVLTINSLGDPQWILPANNTNPIVTFSSNLVDSEDSGRTLYLSVPMQFQRNGDFVTMRFARSGNFTTIATLLNNNSYMVFSTLVPTQFRPTTTQITSFIFRHNQTQDTGQLRVITNGTMTLQSTKYPTNGFEYGGQSMSWWDQSFIYYAPV
jgi:hypothetical protein